jgi:hypothetical protein
MTEPTEVPATSLQSRLSAWWKASRAKLEELVNTYGYVAVAVYFTLFFGTWIGFWMAIGWGFDAESMAGGAGTIGGAYLATKATQPARIGLTALLTPLVARVVRWFRPS